MEWIKDNLAVHSGCLKQRMKTILRLPPWLIYAGEHTLAKRKKSGVLASVFIMG